MNFNQQASIGFIAGVISSILVALLLFFGLLPKVKSSFEESARKLINSGTPTRGKCINDRIIASGFDISPDGTKMVVIDQASGKKQAKWKIIGNPTLTGINLPDGNLHFCNFLGNDTVVYGVFNTGTEVFNIVTFDLATGNQLSRITLPEGDKAEFIEGIDQSFRSLVIRRKRSGHTHYDVYKVDPGLPTVAPVLMAENPGQVDIWFVDWDGNVRSGVSADDKYQGVYTKTAGGKYQRDHLMDIVQTEEN